MPQVGSRGPQEIAAAVTRLGRRAKHSGSAAGAAIAEWARRRGRQLDAASSRVKDTLKAVNASRALRWAALASALAVAIFGLLLLVAPVAAGPFASGMVLGTAFLYWIESGERTWLWPYALTPPRTRRARLWYCFLQLNRGCALTLALVGSVLGVAVVCIGTVIAVALGFDFAADGSVHLQAYVDFFGHTLPRWVTQAWDGRAGGSPP